MRWESPESQEVDLKWAYRMINAGPVVLVSTADGDTPNACTIAWCAPCSKVPPQFMLCIGRRHKTFGNLEHSHILGINIPSADQLDLVRYLGTTSGNRIRKFEQREIPYHMGGVLTHLPLLNACAGWLECRVLDPGIGETSIVLVEAIAARCRIGAFTNDRTWNTEQFPLITHLGGTHFLASGPALEPRH